MFFRLVAAFLVFAAVPFGASYAAPQSFREAKIEARQYVYADRTEAGTLYCGCKWRWVGRSGGRIDHKSCGYQVRAQQTRADRIEWEHIVPASNFGRFRQCWQNGGRQNCKRTDPIFNAMSADLHNLTPSVGEVNADRSNFRYGMLPSTSRRHGACDVKVDFKRRTVEPRDEVKGHLARVYFYMHDRYDIPMSDQQERLLMAWDRRFPPSAWEMERDRRIAARMGHSNPFLSGERKWKVGHKNSAEGVVQPLAPSPAQTSFSEQAAAPVKGNRNSRIYHVAGSCPNYADVSSRNAVSFDTEASAVAAGYRKARNCR